MIKKVNLKETANSVEKRVQYIKVGTLNNHMLRVVTVENRTFT